jgi:hypothetical protein
MNLYETYQWVAILAMIGLVQSSIENFVAALRYPAINLFPLSHGVLTSILSKFFKFAYDSPGIWILAVLRIIFAVLFLVFAVHGKLYYIFPLSLLIIDLLGFARWRLLSASETPLQRVILVPLFLHAYFNSEFISSLGLIFIASQVCLAYFSAGVHKLKDPAWLNGLIMLRFVKNNAQHSKREISFWKWIGYLVILFEISFFLTLLGGGYLIIFFILGIIFHLTLSIRKGYNFFLWAFISGYPAIYYVSRSFSLIIDELL